MARRSRAHCAPQDAEEQEQEQEQAAACCVQPCAQPQPSEASQPPLPRTHGMVTRSASADGAVPYLGLSGCLEAASSMLCLEKLQTWSWFGVQAPIRKHKPALKLSLAPKARMPGKVSRRSPRKGSGRSPPGAARHAKGASAAAVAPSEWQELFPRNGPLIAFGSP